MKARTVQRRKPFTAFIGEKLYNIEQEEKLKDEDMKQRQAAAGGVPDEEPVEEDVVLMESAKKSNLNDSTELDFVDMGEIDPAGGQREKIHTYFDEFLKNKYFNLENEGLTFNDFYSMSERHFKY